MGWKYRIPAWPTLKPWKGVGGHYCWRRMKFSAPHSVFADATPAEMREVGHLTIARQDYMPSVPTCPLMTGLLLGLQFFSMVFAGVEFYCLKVCCCRFHLSRLPFSPHPLSRNKRLSLDLSYVVHWRFWVADVSSTQSGILRGKKETQQTHWCVLQGLKSLGSVPFSLHYSEFTFICFIRVVQVY